MILVFLEKWAGFPSPTSLRSGLVEAESRSTHVVSLSLPLPLLCLYIKVKSKSRNYTVKKQVYFCEV